MNKSKKKENTPSNLINKEYFTNIITNRQFTRLHIPILSIVYIFETNRFLNYSRKDKVNTTTLKLLYYYAGFNKNIKHNHIEYSWNFFHSLRVNNLLSFSKPKKQIFMVFYKNKPIFIFTGGLMRIVMNEKRKSGKKLYKVATSLIKLSAILLFKKNYFPACYLILNKIGSLKSKILNTLAKTKTNNKIQYIIIKFFLDATSQKFNTRRSIKKFLKKKFTT